MNPIRRALYCKRYVAMALLEKEPKDTDDPSSVDGLSPRRSIV